MERKKLFFSARCGLCRKSLLTMVRSLNLTPEVVVSLLPVFMGRGLLPITIKQNGLLPIFCLLHFSIFCLLHSDLYLPSRFLHRRSLVAGGRSPDTSPSSHQALSTPSSHNHYPTCLHTTFCKLQNEKNDFLAYSTLPLDNLHHSLMSGSLLRLLQHFTYANSWI